jgi:hypothetical protein
MLEGYIVGALTALVSVTVGHILAKPWLDKRFNKALQKPVQQPKQGGTP